MTYQVNVGLGGYYLTDESGLHGTLDQLHEIADKLNRYDALVQLAVAAKAALAPELGTYQIRDILIIALDALAEEPDDDECAQFITTGAYGGFAAKIAEAYLVADSDNSDKILETFCVLWQRAKAHIYSERIAGRNT